MQIKLEDKEEDIEETNFKPNMGIINHLYCFHSTSNSTYQTNIGMTTQKFTKVDRLVNFDVTENSGNMLLDSYVFGAWLLKIPTYLYDNSIGNFENYVNTSNGLINFVSNSPVYSIDT